MPALPASVDAYINSVKTALNTGADLGSNLRGAAQNYLRAQDMAQVLELLQTYGLGSGTLDAAGGTTSTVVDAAATFDAGTQVGNTVVFSGNVTTSLTGLSRRIASNDATTLTLEGPALPEAVAALDEYVIVGTMFDEFITDLRQGGGAADAPSGNAYGHHRSAHAALVKGITVLGGTIAERNIGTPGLVTGSDSTDTVIVLNTVRGSYSIDQLRGYRATIDGENSIIVKNDSNTITLRRALSSAPAADTAVAITVPHDDFGSTSAPKLRVHPGAQPGENIILSSRIGQLQALVTSFTTPT